ncbi:caspase family protein [Phytohabitans houttuyneae]|uniref:EF-hand domain-containing protein n=1 Tax=Phytohabitans houttuyneae TaxID=1076126 RepID=A0A6V8KRP6_9ACTN|nr:caspase family protein [Phytohabitans houttuyneae]GFJ85031.1 hypothetical protein Phou_092110 [Phytohabitans houttuyneae]
MIEDAGPPSGGGSSRTVIAIGVEQTEVEGLSALDGPQRDVELLREAFSGAESAERTTFLVLNPSLNDTEARRQINRILVEASPSTSLVFYFSGHADLTTAGQFRLILGGTTDVDVDGLDLATVAGFVRNRGINQCVFILDCCYAGAAAVDVLKGAGPAALASYGYAMLGASGPSSLAKINLATLTSYMTETIAEGILQGRADLNGDGEITVDELWRYCTRRLAGQDDLRIWRSLDGNSDVVVAHSAVPPPGKGRGSSTPNTDYVIYTRWEPGKVLDAVRQALGSVAILETWFPGVESDIAQCGPARPNVNYEFLLLAPDSRFRALRMAHREDYAFTIAEPRTPHGDGRVAGVERKRERSVDWLWRYGYGPNTKLYDAFVPGPVYNVDREMYYGVFLPHADADLGPMHRTPADSVMGGLLRQVIDTLGRWGLPSSPASTRMPQPNDAASSRIERLELAVAWLQRPANGPGAHRFQVEQSFQVIEDWSVEELSDQIRTARQRVFMYQEWSGNAEFTLAPDVIPRRVDARLVALDPEGAFLSLRATLLCGGRQEALAHGLADGQEFARVCVRALRRARGPELRLNSTTFMPVNLCVVDDRVFYTLCLMSADPWRAPVHVVRAASAVGESMLSAFSVLWRHGRPLAGQLT